jgi:flagellar biosynthesis component FlhA
MTQDQLASRLGVTSQAVSKWERGNGFPDITLIEGICNSLDINANTLLGFGETKVIENHNKEMEMDIRNNMISEPLLLEFGENIIPAVVKGLETDYLNQKRKQLVSKTGMLLPLLRIRDNVDLQENQFRILSYDQVLFNQDENMESINSKNDTSNQDNSNQDNSNERDIYTYMIDQVFEVCEKHFATILNKQMVKTMVDNLKESYPGIADDLIPDKISYLQLKLKLQQMIQEGKSIRNLIGIVEEMEANMPVG